MESLNETSTKSNDLCEEYMKVYNNFTSLKDNHSIQPCSLPSKPSMSKIKQLYLKKLKGKRVILNQSLLSSKDVMDFEYESRLKIFYNMPPLDEREKKNKTLNDFLIRLGFDLQAR